MTYPFPLTTNTNVLDIGDKTPMPLPLKLYITPVGAAGGVVIKAGEVIARIHMYKIATLGSGNPRNFTWNIISNNSVVMPTGGCTVDSRNVTVNLPDFTGSAEIPLGVYCSSEQKLSFIFRVPPLTVPEKCLLTQHPMQQKHRAWVSL